MRMPEADANARDDRGQTKLMVAADAGDDAMVATLLAAGADVNCSSRKGTTAVIFAVWRSDPATLQLLVDAGADLTVRCYAPRTFGLGWVSGGPADSAHTVRPDCTTLVGATGLIPQGGVSLTTSTTRLSFL
jgi:hypothetical protein